MERLTDKDEYGYYAPRDVTLNCLKHRGKLVDRLASYEDTGLEPEEVRAMKTAYDKNQIPYLSVGDEVFRLRGRNYIERGQADEIRICKKSGTHIYVRYEAGGRFYTLNEFQKYVCLTREEAEEALKQEAESDG